MPSARPRLLFPASTLLALLGTFVAQSAFAQNTDHDWEKTYSISGKPSLTVETSDSHLDLRSCGDCKAIHIKIHSGQKLSEYRLEEDQSGDHIHFSLKEKPHVGFHVTWHNQEGTRVTIETPGTL